MDKKCVKAKTNINDNTSKNQYITFSEKIKGETGICPPALRMQKKE